MQCAPQGQYFTIQNSTYVANCITKTTNITQLPHELFGFEALSLKNVYIHCIQEQLQNALNEPRRLGIVYNGLIQYIQTYHEGEKKIPIITIALFR